MTGKLSVRILSVFLSAALAVSFSVPSYAGDINGSMMVSEAETADSEVGFDNEIATGFDADQQLDDASDTGAGSADKDALDADAGSNNQPASANDTDTGSDDGAVNTADETAADTESVADTDSDADLDNDADSDDEDGALEDKLLTTDEEITISINYPSWISFPEDSHHEVPTSVTGKPGETRVFIIPYPELPEDELLFLMTCTCKSYENTEIGYIYGFINGDNASYVFEYVISEEDVEEGINAHFDIYDVIDVVFDDGEHGYHQFGADGPRKYSCWSWFFGTPIYPGSTGGFGDGLYYYPDHGYMLEGLYFNEDMKEEHLLFRPYQDGGTQIRPEMLSDDGKLYVYAKWLPLEAKIFLPKVGDSGYAVTFGETFPVFEGYDYTRYYKIQNEQKIDIIPGETVFDENISYYTENYLNGDLKYFWFYLNADGTAAYNVTFETGVDTEIPPQRVEEGKAARDPQVELSNPGYYLDGWYTDPDHKNVYTFGKTPINRNTTLYANWSPVIFNLKFHSDYETDKTAERSFSMDSPASVKEGGVAAKDIFPELKDADGFDGWVSSDGDEYGSDLTGQDLIDLLVDRYSSAGKKVSLEMHARWLPGGQYTAVFDPNLPADSKESNLGGIYAAGARANEDGLFVSDSVYHDETILFNGNEYTLKGFVLTGWEYIKDGAKVSVRTSASLKNVVPKGQTVTFKAQWKKASAYKLSYNLNGGSSGKNKLPASYIADASTVNGIALPNYKKSGDSYVLKDAPGDAAEVTRSGYRFTGWTMNGEQATHYGDDIYENLTLTAEWEIIDYSVLFVDYDGSRLYVKKPVTVNDSVELKKYAPVRPGYTFKGWSAAVKGKEKLFSAKSTLALKNIDQPEGGVYVLKASYTANTYKAAYNLGGGKIGSKPGNYKTDAGSAQAVTDPKLDGHTFAGWTASVTVDGIAQDVDIDDILGADKKIKPGTYGDITFTAHWTPFTYSIEFYDSQGSRYEGIEGLDRYAGIAYAEEVDFVGAADAIEQSDGFDGSRSIKGFAAAQGSTSVKYALNKKYSKLGAKTGNGDVIKLYAVLDVKVNRIFYEAEGGTVNKAVYTYKTSDKDIKITAAAQKKGYVFNGWTADRVDLVTVENGYAAYIKAGAADNITLTAHFTPVSYKVVLMPVGKDVKESQDSLGYIDSKTGIVYGEAAYDTDQLLPEYMGWIREGYIFKGFGKTAKASVPVTELKALSVNGKDVKLYALWEAKKHTIAYDDGEEVEQVYDGKAVNLKKVSRKGFTFLGWEVAEAEDMSKLSVTYTDRTNTYVKSVKKDNNTDAAFRAVFEENRYNLYIDPNGGTYNGSKKKSFVKKAGYTEDVAEELEQFYMHVTKPGFAFKGISTSKNDKGAIRLYSTVGDVTVRNCVSELADKKDGKVTVYALWEKVSPAAPEAMAEIRDDVLTITATAPAEAVCYEFEYSTSPLFISKTAVPQDQITGSTAQVPVDTQRNGQFYVRVKYGVMDSAGNTVMSSFGKVVRASKPAEH